jgi:hypothetical protein
MKTEPASQAPALEPQTDEQRQAYILSARRRIGQGVFLALVTLITIFSLCVAWFMNNSQVSANAMQLQSSAASNFELAAVGTSGGLFDTFLNTLFPESESWASGTLSGTRTSFGASEITWMLNDSSNLSNLNTSGLEPGMRGYLTFYVIPTQSGDLHIRCSLTELLYEAATNGDPVEITNSKKSETLAALLSKHLLFFLLEPADTAADNGSTGAPEAVEETEESEGDGGESAATPQYTATWLRDGAFTLDISNAEVNVPQEVTLYWVWPYLFGQLLIQDSTTLLNQPALLDSATITNASDLYEELRSDILGTAATADTPSAVDTEVEAAPDDDAAEDNASSDSIDFRTGYFYSANGDFSLSLSTSANGQPATLDAILQSIANGGLTSSEYASLNEAYNDADQYIGENLSYFSVRLTASTG